MNKRNGTVAGLFLLAILMLLVFFPLHTEASTNIYIRKGVTGYISFQKSPVPNCKWKVNNSSILKLKKSTATKAVYTGKKVGKAILTAYNKNNTSQKYNITVYVMPSGKLNKMDFKMYGKEVVKAGYVEGYSFLNRYSQFSYDGMYMLRIPSITKNNSSQHFQTTRTAKLLDSYSRIKTLYGKSKFKKYKFSNDRLAKYLKIKIPTYYKNYQPFARNNFKYYMDYKYGKKHILRFLFNKKKQVTGIMYFKNYNQLPVK